MQIRRVFTGGEVGGSVRLQAPVIGSHSALAMSVHPTYFDLATPLTMIHNYLKIYYLHYPSGMLEDCINWNMPTWIACRLQSYSLRAYCQNTQRYYCFICFERKNAWSRFALILFKLHEIWLVDSRKIIKIVATRYYILKAKMHQIQFQFRLRLRPRPRLGCLQRSPRPPSWT